ncbi:pentatricopeptide repeat-containing protein At4g21300 [Andrographis paniculata]|uniref:pentatricopeptide repeat-containing protein At4g21300 n=1 Tax=Andrographis paniculata TaxID=175694 RepID=UPI0021E85A58|nr:pentatricopeptide repeat-containing protein At4g21300 [Andrographis paniculata]XP_051128948.1 pentatricopeptide repeat-containing protein At4g21300 [Andrographis paniculata]XP_051128949.1 pentatricopeptide repeat-containing protein At4g21300 [Andrographis paniculata]XP_051128950.1 pentatricopeptide repeat-containing protein At4g21300 [Andrographis paniculata]XP_051128951.1 pentatricopeptide repeat-containing protein At4g21300 [Andrographis paniculata]
MYTRISTILSQDFCSNNKFFHSIPKHSHYFPYTEEALASHLAPLLRQKDPSLFPSVLQKTQQIHAQVTVNGIHNFGILGSRVLGAYLLGSCYLDARKLFYQLHLGYAAPWNWMIRGSTAMGSYDCAIMFYFKMLIFGTRPDKYTFPCVIKACGGLRAVDLVKHLHRLIKDLGFELDVYIGSALVKFYAENGCLGNAVELFDKLPQRDIVLWNVMLNCCLKSEGTERDVIGLFQELRRGEVEPNSVTYSCILSMCGLKSMVGFGRQVHGLVVRSGLEMDSPVANTLIAMYAKCQCLFDARKFFDFVTQADLVTWNVMIGGYVQNGFMNDALNTLQMMVSSGVKPDSVTFASLLTAIPDVGGPDQGKEIHGYIVRHGLILDLFLKNALIDMYFKCKDVEMACRVFHESSALDIVICTAMISGFVLNGMNADALKIFQLLLHKKMKPNPVTIASILPACAGLTALKLGKELHGHIIRKGLEGRLHVGSALTDMYAKCGRLDLGHEVFSRMPERDSVCWNSMITSYSQNGKPEQAMDLFSKMQLEGVKYDGVTLSAALCACADSSALHHGKEIHGFMIRRGFNFDLFANSALMDTYAKCGHLDLAQCVFDSMECINEVSWNSIIAAHGNHGQLEQCLELFHRMEDNGFQPDHVTFLAILSACGHAGRVEEGKHYFNLMIQDYGIAARMEHYACLIDLYGRAGCLQGAFQVINEMPFHPDAGIWGTILGACRIHGNVELAEVASKHLFHLDPQNSGYYVILSNLHANSGTWSRVDEIRSIMKERGVQKIPGYSWIEVNNSSHVFGAADKRHPESSQIYLLLNCLLLDLQEAGYAPQMHPPIQPQVPSVSSV